MDDGDVVVEQYQTFGRIASADEVKGIAVERGGQNGCFVIPCGLHNTFPAPRGDYRLRCSGETVVNADFTTSWTQLPKGRAIDIEDAKRSGFEGLARDSDAEPKPVWFAPRDVRMRALRGDVSAFTVRRPCDRVCGRPETVLFS